MSKRYAEFSWLTIPQLCWLFSKYEEDQLREVVRWIDEAPEGTIRSKVEKAFQFEMTRRASRAYEEMHQGEWI